MIPEQAINQLRTNVRGKLLQAEDADYDVCRKVYNGMFDRRPEMIVRCADVADVIAAVNFARENNLLLAIKGGGHNAAGLGMCDEGLVIDLSPMKGVYVDFNKNAVRKIKRLFGRILKGCCW